MFNEYFSADFWRYEFLGNFLMDYGKALIAFLVFLLVFKIFQNFILRRLQKITKRTKTDIDDILVQVIQTLRPPFYSFIAFYLTLNFLKISAVFGKVVNIVLITWIVYQAVIALQVLVDYFFKKKIKKEKEVNAQSAFLNLGKLLKALLWAAGVLFVLSNLGVNVTSLIAGLGIGGVAVAFALQNILSDLFSSFAIYFDKPFVVGDFIVVGDKMGSVERIGIKTTRIRALQGEEIVISNRELTSEKIQNFKNMKERRVVFSFGVIYETPAEKLKKIPALVSGVINRISSVRFDRAHLGRFDDSALTFEVVYYVKNSSYNQYMDINQSILFGLKQKFDEAGIELAYPTQTVYLPNKKTVNKA